MRRFLGHAAVRRAVDGVVAAPSIAGNQACNHRLLQTALFGTTATNNSLSARSHWFWYKRIADDRRATRAAITGTMLFSVAAVALVEEVRAKEPVKSEYLPKDVVIYQFEACPFCNKVKGIYHFCFSLSVYSDDLLGVVLCV